MEGESKRIITSAEKQTSTIEGIGGIIALSPRIERHGLIGSADDESQTKSTEFGIIQHRYIQHTPYDTTQSSSDIHSVFVSFEFLF